MLFSEIVGDARIAPGKPGCADVKWTALGKVIADTIHGFPNSFPIVAMYHYCVMPDHVHILLRIKERSSQHLGYYISHLTGRIAKRYGELSGKEIASTDIFAKNYTDKIIYANRSLDAIFRYIRENPHRLAMRRQYPDFFRRVRNLKIGDKEYEAYGNLFLFRNPDKTAVKISRSYSEAEKQELKALWLKEAESAGVLVSPFIAQGEKMVRVEAERLGANVILVTHEAFGERFKPSDHDFALCSDGRLLIVSLGKPHGTPLSRDLCVEMNSLAARISGL